MFRLNIGCGNKILEGWINVDAMPPADVVCDIRAMPSEWENHFDEAMAIHVLEHQAFYEADAALIEWKRVLKPGGLLIIESPCLRNACLSYLQDPEDRSFGLFPLYGDQSRGDAYTVHKSGWTAASLIKQLQRVGFVNCRQEPAQFKRREPRDFRVVGEKA